jgi:hypothetical protein
MVPLRDASDLPLCNHSWRDAKRSAREGRYKLDESLFPSVHYYLDESDPDIVILRRQDDAFVAAFSAEGATKESVRAAARADYWALLRELMAEPKGSQVEETAGEETASAE